MQNLPQILNQLLEKANLAVARGNPDDHIRNFKPHKLLGAELKSPMFA